MSLEPSPLIQQETETESLDEARLAAGIKAETPGYLGDASGQQSRTPDQAHSPNAPTETDAQAPVIVPASPAEVQGYLQGSCGHSPRPDQAGAGTSTQLDRYDLDRERDGRHQ